MAQKNVKQETCNHKPAFLTPKLAFITQNMFFWQASVAVELMFFPFTTLYFC